MLKRKKLNRTQESISVGGVPPDRIHQMSAPVGRGGVLVQRGPMFGLGWDRGTSTMESNASWEMVTWRPPPPPVNRHTDKTENITFMQFRWGTVKMSLKFKQNEK